jgi:zinc protease
LFVLNLADKKAYCHIRLHDLVLIIMCLSFTFTHDVYAKKAVSPNPTQDTLPQTLQSPFAHIEVMEETLSNGLTLVMSPDHRIPTVAVEVRYLVGSAHERKGRSGFAHLFEHLMFQGSRSYDQEYFTPFTPIGARVNGTTNTDRTNYYEQVPAEALELALWMESDRMEGLLEVLTQAKLDNQRDVVKNERRQRYENRPYGMIWKIFSNELYPLGHPYQHTTIGSHKDLTAATLDDVKAFFKKYYVPANAVVTLVGDFDPKEARSLVQRYFGHLPSGKRAAQPQASIPKLAVERLITFKDKIKLPRVYLAWHTPALYKDGDAALDLLSSILSDGKTSRLYKPLVFDQKIAKDVSAYQVSHAMSSFFVVSATVAPGQDINTVSDALSATLSKALQKVVSHDEFSRALNGWRKSFYQRVESVLSRAQMLSTYYHFIGHANAFQSDLERYTQLTPSHVHKVARQWLTQAPLRVHFVPKESEVMVAPDRSKPPVLKASKAWKEPKVESWKTANGLEVWYVHQKQAPLTSLQLILDGGGSVDPVKQAGLSALMVDLMDEGAGDYNALALSKKWQQLASDYQASVGTDSISFDMDVLSEQLQPSLVLLKDILTKPHFTAEDFKRVQEQRIAQTINRSANPRGVLNLVTRRVLFGDGYAGLPNNGFADSLKKITLEDIKKSHQALINPQGATLIVVGSVSKTQVQSALDQTLTQWTGKATMKRRAVQTQLKKTGIHWIDFPKSTQSAIAVVKPIASNMAVQTPFADQLFNRVYGGSFTSRLNLNLREDKGYTYGAYSGLYRYQHAGMFLSSAMVKADTTLASLQEIYQELKSIQAKKPITQSELDKVRTGLLKGFPSRFETLSDVANVLGGLRSKKKSSSWLTQWQTGIRQSTLAQVKASAKTLAPTETLQIIIAGDFQALSKKIKTLSMPIHLYDKEGKFLRTKSVTLIKSAPKAVQVPTVH